MEELLGKVMCVWGDINFIRGYVDFYSRSTSMVDFKGFRFSKVYKRFRVKKV